MQYISTRGKSEAADASQAIIQGLAGDGGLYVPERFPPWTLNRIQALCDLPYASVAARVMGDFLSEFSSEEINGMTHAAYGPQFDDPFIVPLSDMGHSEQLMELYHGPTLAFKDMALQILPHLMSASMQKTGEKQKVLILVATSGDTGKAALEGFQDVPGVAIMVFYPQDGVSAAQKRQMITQEGANLSVCGVQGNFDDAQNGVKRIFSDAVFAQKAAQAGYRLSSANSINWGRLLPQIAYYFWAYAFSLKNQRITAGEKLNFVVPTGNFGNILAGYYAKRMGLPVGKLVCASNQNHVLSDFFAQGTYDRNRPFYKTISPSMDILISSNLERLLFELANRDGAAVDEWMQQLRQGGRYELSTELQQSLKEDFAAGWCDEKMCADSIRQTFTERNKLIDPHTAVAQAVYGDFARQNPQTGPCVVAATASPYKFAADVLAALRQNRASDGDVFQTADALSAETHTLIPQAILDLRDKPVLHRDTCKPEEMPQQVLSQLERWA